MIDKIDFSFGICSSKETCSYIPRIVSSIKALNIPNYEIIIIGNVDNIEEDEYVKIIEFDETIKPRWLNKKKNMITENAQYENIVYIHDYNSFDIGWYEGFLKFGNDFKIASSITLNGDGSRYRDWILLWNAIEGVPKMQFILPYTETRLSKYMYINGSYWVAKKYVMEKYPLDKDLVWGQGEDVEWSKRVSQEYDFSINTHSIIRMLKQSNRAWDYMSDGVYQNVVLPFIDKNNL
jgi:hypothetical protein